MNAVPDKAVIEEVALELGIDPAFVEKDWYVVQILSIVNNCYNWQESSIVTLDR